MFQINEIVAYGNQGICEVTEISNKKSPVSNEEKLYYTLRPINQKEAVVFVPVENRKTTMRYALTKKSAEELIQRIHQIKEVELSVDKRAREAELKSLYLAGDPESYIKMIKALYKRKQERIKKAKKILTLDDRYLKQAEDRLFEELGYALDVEKKKIGIYIIEKIIEVDNL